jgi:predicted MFS family arabinose efflux permease
LVAAWAPNITVYYWYASLCIGITSVIAATMLIPMAAHLAKPQERGKKIGFIMSGLLIGILLIAHGEWFYLRQHFGWRAMFLYRRRDDAGHLGAGLPSTPQG